uniref:E3 ubiquitin-protein ligase n=1 Tax=Mola mola TaxID=94237 RepID=A0A3Q3XFF4_MOLML
MSSVDSVNDTIDQLLRSEEDERRAEGARRYKLAAQFKDTGLAVEKRMRKTKCGATLCSKCLDTVHIHCRVCHETEPTPRGIQGEMSYSRLHISVPGYKKDYAIKVTYCIPDGIQEDGHPSPGMPFQGGVFEAYLPDCDKTRKLLPRLEKAFRQGLTFTVTEKETGGRVAWDCIPHKTSLHGGKSGNGYPDSTYFTRLSEVLTSYGIEALPDK